MSREGSALLATRAWQGLGCASGAPSARPLLSERLWAARRTQRPWRRGANEGVQLQRTRDNALSVPAVMMQGPCSRHQHGACTCTSPGHPGRGSPRPPPMASDEHEHPLAPNPLAAAWSIASPQREPVTGGVDYPSVRYSASSVMYNGEMIVTHGYFYDHGNRHPAWQSNAWAFNIKLQTWRKIHEGERAGAPSARYCSSAVLFEHGLWLFGGDDGGHKTSMNNYIFNAHFDELWRFDLRSYQWRKVEPRAGPRPPKRALHSAVEVSPRPNPNPDPNPTLSPPSRCRVWGEGEGLG